MLHLFVTSQILVYMCTAHIKSSSHPNFLFDVLSARVIRQMNKKRADVTLK